MACFNKIRSQHRRTRVSRVCKVCGKSFEVKAHRANAKFCSKACWSVRKPKKDLSCPTCGKTFKAWDHHPTRFCSQRCAGKSRVGDMANAWKGGTSLNGPRAKYKGELKRWREAVFRRDQFKCVECGRSGEIQAHHIQTLSDRPDLALELSNGKTLCVPCHEAIHGRKLTSPGKFKKRCAECGNRTPGRHELCRSCSSKRAHRNIGNGICKPCEHCGKIVKRAHRRFCSVRCGLLHRHAKRSILTRAS
jgi:endogenous inhibitor of DNA gyrase (YacG/DUF329 family)